MQSPIFRVLCTLTLTIVLSACAELSQPTPTATQPPALSSPTAPPSAAELFATAMAARQQNDDETLGMALSTLLSADPNAPEARPARYYLAESYARRGNWSSAAELFRQVAAQPSDQLGQQALFWLARCAEEAGDAQGALSYYAAYREQGGPLAAYATLRRAAQLRALGDLQGALSEYEAAARSPIATTERAVAFERAIGLQRELGAPAAALGLYAELLAIAENPSYRAGLLSAAAQLAAELGQAALATEYRREVLQLVPASPLAVASSEALLASGQLAPIDAAWQFFSAERFDLALPQIDAALLSGAEPSAISDLRRMRGLILRSNGDFAAALPELEAAINAAPETPAGQLARLAWIQTLGQSGQTDAAAVAYLAFASDRPSDPLAPEALQRAALLRERLGDQNAAWQIRLELARRYPTSGQAQSELPALAAQLAAAARPAEAREAQLLLLDHGPPSLAAEAALNAGRAAQANGDPVLASELFGRAQRLDPESYAAARAAELLQQPATGSLQIGAPISDAAWAELLAWVAGWSSTPADQPLSPPAAEALARADALSELRLSSEARAEWAFARQTASQNPLDLVGVARAATARNATTEALRTAEALRALAPADAPPAPIALLQLRFPTPFAELVREQSRIFGLDPRLFFALMRQESLFDPNATSWVGARGLAQVMPETGAGIAANLGVSDFSVDDLYQPAVSVRFGTFYLATRIDDMNGSAQAALAAYNGGLGNALRWAGGDTVADPEAFVAAIDFPETANYVRKVYGYYWIYRTLYSE